MSTLLSSVVWSSIFLLSAALSTAGAQIETKKGESGDLRPVTPEQIIGPQSLKEPMPLPKGARILSPWQQGQRPIVYAGPFTESRFDQIRVKLSYPVPARPWSYGTYFQGHPDASVFQRYIANPLPVSPTTTVSRMPIARPSSCGQSPPTTCPGIILLALSSIHYSSRYGGTIRLVFKPVDDAGVELFSGSTAWDIKGLTMSVYVAPNITWFNGSISADYEKKSMAGVEFSASGAIQYAVSPPTPAADAGRLDMVATDLGALTQALKDLAAAVRPKLAIDAVPFATAFVHSKLQDDIAPDNLVDSMAISDNSIVVKTHVAQAFFTVYWRGGNITAPGYNPAESEYDYQVTVMPGALFFLGTDVLYTESLQPHLINLKGQGMTYGIPLATWKPKDCTAWQMPNAPQVLWGIMTEYTVIEKTLGADREFKTKDHFFVFELCKDIVEKAAVTQPFRSQTQILRLDLATGFLGGQMTTEYWVVLEYR